MPKALEDLDKIWDDVAEVSGSFDVAEQYIQGLTKAVRERSSFPKAGIPLLGPDGRIILYSVNFKAYKAFYCILSDSIAVVRVLYAASDYMKVLFPSTSDEDEHL